MCGRSHTLGDVEEALAAVAAAQPPSWSLDLISGAAALSDCLTATCPPATARPDRVSHAQHILSQNPFEPELGSRVRGMSAALLCSISAPVADAADACAGFLRCRRVARADAAAVAALAAACHRGAAAPHLSLRPAGLRVRQMPSYVALLLAQQGSVPCNLKRRLAVCMAAAPRLHKVRCLHGSCAMPAHNQMC